MLLLRFIKKCLPYVVYQFCCIFIDVFKETNRPRPLAFDSNKHKVLNTELKQLYTAITRARVHVWIFDESEDARAPMFEYFKARGLVQTVADSEAGSELSIECNLLLIYNSSANCWDFVRKT